MTDNQDYTLSDERDEFGRRFVLSSDGTTVFGVIGEESGLTPAPIKLSEGEDSVDKEGRHHGYGLKHIEAGHGEQIRVAGFRSVAEFVETVSRNYNTIREGNVVACRQTYLLELTNGHNDTVFIELSRDGSYWSVNSAGIYRIKYSKKKKEVKSLPAVGISTVVDADRVNRGTTQDETATSGNSLWLPLKTKVMIIFKKKLSIRKKRKSKRSMNLF